MFGAENAPVETVVDNARMPDDIQFYDNADGSAPQTPRRRASDARIERYRVMPWPDGTRVTVEMTFGAFTEFPSIDVCIVNTAGEVVRQTALVSSMERQPAPTMWLPPVPLANAGSWWCMSRRQAAA